ncbi:unnamed protein product [Ostreobium quekettii]|uniref:Glutathione S-transferase n=1 Tax=Ostreobium quekettii TaxID=121088 RepID=A0A8S1JA38_9CHLO|nr:unnamed protein product [Ostreobium quekettii]
MAIRERLNLAVSTLRVDSLQAQACRRQQARCAHQPLPMAPSLRLTYFDFMGRAEPIRLALSIGGVPFQDERLTLNDFAALKPSLPFAQLPVIDVGGESLAQAPAILRYAGKLSGLLPRDPIAAMRADEIIFAVQDAIADFGPSTAEREAARRLEMRRALAAETLPGRLEMIERRIRGRGTEYCAGEEMTVADLSVYCFFRVMRGGDGALEGIPTGLVDAYEEICAVCGRVEAHPKVREWNDAHRKGE